MGCTGDHYSACRNGFDYYYGNCCNKGMSTFWTVFLWISIFLCVCLCCSMMMAMVRRRRMQMMMAQ